MDSRRFSWIRAEPELARQGAAEPPSLPQYIDIEEPHLEYHLRISIYFSHITTALNINSQNKE